jgi:hypothetical protein
MQTAETITAKLHAKAESELRERLKKVFAEARREFTDGCCKSINVKGGYIEGDNNRSKEFIVDAHHALSQLEDLAFEMQREKAKADAVNEFMRKVESLESELDEIRSSIN